MFFGYPAMSEPFLLSRKLTVQNVAMKLDFIITQLSQSELIEVYQYWRFSVTAEGAGMTIHG